MARTFSFATDRSAAGTFPINVTRHEDSSTGELLDYSQDVPSFGIVTAFPGVIRPIPGLKTPGFYFVVDGSGFLTTGSSVWVTSGTTESARMVFEMPRSGPYAGTSTPDANICFRTAVPHQVWKTDGTVEGTKVLGIFGEMSDIQYSEDAIAAFNDAVVVAGWSEEGGTELWRFGDSVFSGGSINHALSVDNHI